MQQNLPNVEITPFHIAQDDLPNEDANPDEWFNITGLRSDNFVKSYDDST